MSQGAQIVALARGWIGTPYVHQASCRGAGADCLGLLRGIWREIYGAEPCAVPAYTADWSEPAGREDLLAAAAEWLVPCDAAPMEPGQVLVFRMRPGSVAKHLGLVSDCGPHARFVHAYSGHGVVENALTDAWRRKIAARFRFPEGV